MRHRYAAIALALATATTAVGGCKRGHACDSDALNKAVQTVEDRRKEHPAWFGDLTKGRFSGPLVRDQILEACPKLPPDLQSRLQSYASMWDERAPLVKMSEDQAQTYRARRDKVCKDSSVFDELGPMAPEDRSKALLQRCGFGDEYRLGERVGEAFARAYLFVPIFRQFLIDDGIDPALAKRTVELLGYPFPHEQALAKLPQVPQPATPAPERGLLIRATTDGVSLVEGPTVALSRGETLKSEALSSWIDTQMPDDAPSWDVQLVLDFDASLPASTVAAVASAVDPQTRATVSLLTEDPRMISAENVTLPMPPPESTHRLAIEDGTLTVSAQGNDDGPMVSTPHDQLGPLTTWAAKAGPQTSVEIDPAGLDVQGLVDIIVALRGPECRLLGFMHGEEAPEECHVLHYRFPAGGAN